MLDIEPRNPYVGEIEAFSAAVETGRPFHADGVDGLMVVHAQEAIVESARSGNTVEIKTA